MIEPAKTVAATQLLQISQGMLI